MIRWASIGFALLSCTSGTAVHDAGPGSDAELAVPVTIATARIVDLPVVVNGPGRTATGEKLDIRAPFDGVLVDLAVADGDHVTTDQVLGSIISQDSAAALAGAREMLRSARTQTERRDARRARALARRYLVKKPLRAPEAALVLSHNVDEGAHVTANESIVTLVPVVDIMFMAQIAQPDLQSVRAGQPASIELASSPQPLAGTVHAILPGASSTDLTAPVRIDFSPHSQPRLLVLYRGAHITVGHHPHALVVPVQAVVRDDVTGVARVAVIDHTDHAHWVQVQTGLQHDGLVELVSAPLSAGARVVVAGQVGLPEGAHVETSRASS